MLDWIRAIIQKILHLSKQLDDYEKDSVVQALPSLAYVNRAKKCIANQDFEQAERILEEAMELPQEDALVYKYLGMVCERTGRPSEAVISYKKSANINSSDKDIWRLLGFALINCGQFEEALESFENANKVNPANTDVFAGWGMAYMRLKRYPEAHEKFMEAVRLNRYNFMALLLAAIMEVRLGKYNDADAKLSFLANVSPNETNTYEYANLKYIRKDYDSAIFYANKALSFNDKMLPVYLLLGKLYAIKGQKKESLETYENAVSKGLAFPHLFFDWAVTLQIFGDYEGAKVQFEKARSIAPGEEEVSAGLALTNAYSGNIEEAEHLMQNVRNLKDDNYVYSKATGLIAMRKGDYTLAISKFKNVTDLMFFDNGLNFLIAQCYDSINDVSNAKEYYETSLLNAGDNIDIYLKYSDFLIRNEEFESAQRKLKRAQKIDENNLDVLNLLFHIGYILVKDNWSEYNMKETLGIAEKILKIDPGSFRYPEEKSDLDNIANNR